MVILMSTFENRAIRKQNDEICNSIYEANVRAFLKIVTRRREQ